MKMLWREKHVKERWHQTMLDPVVTSEMPRISSTLDPGDVGARPHPTSQLSYIHCKPTDICTRVKPAVNGIANVHTQ